MDVLEEVANFLDGYNKWLGEVTDEDGEPIDIYRYDEGRTDWSLDAWELLEHIIGLIDQLSFVDSHGTKYQPWTDGRVLGYRCTKGDRVEYLYFNPSTGDSDGMSNVFVYQGVEGDPNLDGAYTYFAVCENDARPVTAEHS